VPGQDPQELRLTLGGAALAWWQLPSPSLYAQAWNPLAASPRRTLTTRYRD
jgi:hypothetical protein